MLFTVNKPLILECYGFFKWNLFVFFTYLLSGAKSSTRAQRIFSLEHWTSLLMLLFIFLSSFMSHNRGMTVACAGLVRELFPSLCCSSCCNRVVAGCPEDLRFIRYTTWPSAIHFLPTWHKISVLSVLGGPTRNTLGSCSSSLMSGYRSCDSK